MAASTAPIDTPERAGNVVAFPVAADTTIYAGSLVALNTSGNAVPASDTNALVVVGRAEATVTNGATAGAQKVDVKRGVFRYGNSGTNAVDADDRGKFAFVEDDNTVAETSTHKVKAGVVVDVDADGVWIDTTRNFLTAADSITGAADLAALKTALVALFNNPFVGVIK